MSPVAGLSTAFHRADGSRIAMSPWSRDAANPVALAVLEARCAELDVNASTVKRRDGSWMVRVRRDNVTVSLVGAGPLEAVIAEAIDDFEAATDYTADELLQIRRQSA